MTLIYKNYDDLLESLPDEEEVIANAQAVLKFVGEKWVDDRAEEVEDGEFEFTIPLEELYNKQREEWTGLHSTSTRYHVADNFHTHQNAPTTVQNWEGPFELQIKEIKT